MVITGIGCLHLVHHPAPAVVVLPQVVVLVAVRRPVPAVRRPVLVAALVAVPVLVAPVHAVLLPAVPAHRRLRVPAHAVPVVRRRLVLVVPVAHAAPVPAVPVVPVPVAVVPVRSH